MDTLVIVLTCPECKSKFQLVGKIKPGSPQREFNCKFEILELSEMACEALKPKYNEGPPRVIAPEIAGIPLGEIIEGIERRRGEA